MFIEQVPFQSLGNTTYVAGSEQSGQCAVIDPVRDGRRDTQVVDELGSAEWMARGYPWATGEE